MDSYTVADVTYDSETDEPEQFLLFWDGGEPETKRATPENMLLFDPEDELPFDNGLYEFVAGETALRLSADPELIVTQAGNEYSYIIHYDGDTIETTPSQAEQVLEGVYDALTADDDTSVLEQVHRTAMEKQVRRRVINTLKNTFDEYQRIEIMSNGWVIDNLFIVDWSANLYTTENDPDEGDYFRSGGSVVQKDTSHEFIQFHRSSEFEVPDSQRVRIGNENYDLTEREMLFLTKVKWVLNREYYHPDEPFWLYVEKWTDIEESSEEPSLDSFNI
jgi:hypothetical protein